MRAIASVTLSFGLVSIPVKLYSATDASSAVRFKLMGQGGARLRQQYVADAQPGEPAPLFKPRSIPLPAAALTRGAVAEVEPPAAAAVFASSGRRPLEDIAERASHTDPEQHEDEQAEPSPGRAASDANDDLGEDLAYEPRDTGLVERHQMARGYEFEKGRFVLFTPDELKALKAAGRDSIDIVGFIPDGAVDPLYFDKAYLVAPDKRGEKTYALLLEALGRSGRTALARWAWKGKEYVVQIRPSAGGLVLQQLFYADEVRLPAQLGLRLPAVGDAELQLALKLIEQGAQELYDPTQFVDEERQRILAAVEDKIAGGSVVSHQAVEHQPRASGQVIDLLEALRASLKPTTVAAAPPRKPVARSGSKTSGTVTRLPTKTRPAAKKSQGR